MTPIGRHQKNNFIKKAQIILSKTNDSAYKAYGKMGFEIASEKFCDNLEIIKILPSNKKLMMEKLF